MKCLALTFDDGPDPRWTPRILDILAAADARATFFVLRDHVVAHPELVRRAAELCGKYGRPVATWQQARQILGLRMPA